VTLTNSSASRNPFGDRIRVVPLNFEDPGKLSESLRGVSVLYNTYWVRFNYARFSHAGAVRNTRILFDAAKAAGVKRVVHISITNPSINSDLEYFRGKAELENALKESGMSYAILRPAVLFGKEDILVNNIAWMLRRFPVFGVFGNGTYRLQPIYVDDLALLAVTQADLTERTVINAIGPESFTYRQLVQTIGRIIGKPRPIISIPPWLGYYLGSLMGKIVGDVILTRQEIIGLMRGLLCVDSPPAGETRLSEWASEHRTSMGVQYASELARRR
jgi:uncharacterized protein YbjT (DUF2867 family)